MREYAIGTLIDIGAPLAGDLVALIMADRPVRPIARGERIFAQGAAAEDVVFLVDGRAKTVLINASGGESLLRLHLPQSLMGLTSLASNPVRDAEAVALTDGRLVRIERGLFREILAREPALSAYVITLLVNRMSDFHHRVGELLVQSVEQRIAQALLSLSRPGSPVTAVEEGAVASPGNDTREPIALTHEELASLLNTRRPTVTATLSRFEQAGFIARKERRLTVVDAEALASVVTGET